MKNNVVILTDVDEQEPIYDRALKLEMLYRDASNYKTAFMLVVPCDDTTKTWEKGDTLEMGTHPYLPSVMEFFDSVLHPYMYNPEFDHNCLNVLNVETCDPICIGLVWVDPDVITGNDYQITYIKVFKESGTALIHYGMSSEAEVPLSEIGKFNPLTRKVTYPFAETLNEPAA